MPYPYYKHSLSYLYGASMKPCTFKLDNSNFRAAHRYLQEQFRTNSWWPREQPHIAQQELLCLHDRPSALQIWCDKWLDAGQWQQLEHALVRADQHQDMTHPQ